MIELRNVTRVYQDTGAAVVAVEGISLEIARNEFVAITGPSGGGKSTLMHLIGGLDQPTSGAVIVDGVALHRATEAELTDYRRRRLGVVFQFFNLLPAMNVLENVQLPLLLQGESHRVAEARAEEMLELVGLSGRAGHFAHQLSGGEMQRAAVARALIHKPAVLLADEPTGNLDSGNAGQVIDLFRKLHEAKLTTLVLVTHSEEVAAAAGRRIRIRDGVVEGA